MNLLNHNRPKHIVEAAGSCSSSRKTPRVHQQEAVCSEVCSRCSQFTGLAQKLMLWVVRNHDDHVIVNFPWVSVLDLSIHLGHAPGL